MEKTPLYLLDSYQKEFNSIITDVNDKFIILENTLFYPNSGGQPFDSGTFFRESDKKEFKIIFVGKFNGKISHEINEVGLKIGDIIHGLIDWERRYKHMRAHSAAHILAESLFRNSGCLTTGNQLSENECRIDSNFEYSKELIEKTFHEANEIIKKDLIISAQIMSREEAEKLPRMTKLAKGLPIDIQEVRILNIGDYDIQADGGTHVKSTKEIGKIEFVKYESKGKNNKRIYFKIID
jgi:Ser-tRNA(Ala) deacylase AlaX